MIFIREGIEMNANQTQTQTQTKLYSLKNADGCYFGTCEATTIRKAANIFKKSYSGKFIINAEGESKCVNL